MHHIGHDGIEPSLLPYQRSFLPLKECPESVMGFEPIQSAWKADMLAVNITPTASGRFPAPGTKVPF